MKRFVMRLIFLALICLSLTACSTFSTQGKVDDGLFGDTQEVFAVVDTAEVELELNNADSENTSDEETFFNDLFDNAFEETDVQQKEPEIQTQQTETPEKQVPVQDEQNKVQQQSSLQTSASGTSTVSGGVWIPQSGKKYHSYAGCSGMKNPRNVTLEEAQSGGFTACKRCY